MKIFIDINHPAHVHFFKNFIWEMEKKGCEFFISSRDKEVALHLLDAYRFDYYNRGEGYTGLAGKTYGIVKNDWGLYRKAKRFKPDIFLGLHNTYTAHVSRLLSKPSITFTDTEHAKLANLITFPFTDVIATPTCFLNDLGEKHVRYDGFHELAYLHPKRFTPDKTVLSELGVDENDKYYLIRFVSWGASHDVSQRGLRVRDKQCLIDELRKKGLVFISSESKLPKEFEEYRISIKPERIHDVLYYADMFIGEGGTMATEAALLGTPSIYFSSLVGTMGNFIELKENGLVHSFSDFGNMMDKIVSILDEGHSKRVWGKKRAQFIKGKVDVTAFMTWFVEDYPESFQIMKNDPSYQKRFF